MKFCCECGSAQVRRHIPPGDIGLRYECDSCGRRHYSNPNVVTGCIATWQGKLLLCRRAIEPARGLWTIPAGYLEMGETLAEGACREAAEEAGAQVDGVELWSIIDLPSFGEIYVIYTASLVTDRLAAGSETAEAALVDPQRIPWDELAFPMVREALRAWVRSGGRHSTQVHTAAMFWGPEGAVRIRRPRRT